MLYNTARTHVTSDITQLKTRDTCHNKTANPRNIGLLEKGSFEMELQPSISFNYCTHLSVKHPQQKST